MTAVIAATIGAPGGWAGTFIVGFIGTVFAEEIMWNFDSASRRVLHWSGSGWPRVKSCMVASFSPGRTHPSQWHVKSCGLPAA